MALRLEARKLRMNPARRIRSQLLQISRIEAKLFTCRAEDAGRHLLPRMRPRPPGTPVERLGLMAENVASFLLGSEELDGEWVVLVHLGMRHRQADDDARPFVERLDGKNQQWMLARHLLACLGVVVDPDEVALLGYPSRGRSENCQRISLPTGRLAIASPPCFLGSKALSFCARVRRGMPCGAQKHALPRPLRP